jgi:hypothetical protein
MEAFEAPPDPQQLTARLEVVGRHASSALYNAVEHQRIPMRFLWKPLAKLQDGLGGKGKTISALAVMLLSLLISALILLPYPLKMEASGTLQPRVRRIVFTPVDGVAMEFKVSPGDVIGENHVLARMQHLGVSNKITTLEGEMRAAILARDEAKRQMSSTDATATERASLATQAAVKQAEHDNKKLELEEYIARVGALREMRGSFQLKAPLFAPHERELLERKEWTVLTSDFKESVGKEFKPTEPILRLGAKDGPWEIELKIPQKHIGQILRAFETLKKKDGEEVELDVDFLVKSDPTRVFKGKLARDKIAGEANPNKDDNNESEPVVIAYVRIEGDDIPAGYRLDKGLQVSGTEVHAKVRCGDQRLGYSLFYGVWEFLYEKVVFFF